jgi:hypothetical protein
VIDDSGWVDQNIICAARTNTKGLTVKTAENSGTAFPIGPGIASLELAEQRFSRFNVVRGKPLTSAAKDRMVQSGVYQSSPLPGIAGGALD